MASNRYKYREIIKEIGSRGITLADICDPDSPKQRGLLQMMRDPNTPLTYDELLILRQYAEGILEGSTRAAEFIRDTAGERPSNDVNLTTRTNPISDLSDEEIASLIAQIKEGVSHGDDIDDCPVCDDTAYDD